MIILGLDPGSRKAGYAVIQVNGRKWEYLNSGVLRFDREPNFLYRLKSIYQKCEELQEKFHPQAVALESLIYVKNVTSLAKLAQARGAMIAAFSDEKCDNLFEYSPNFVKTSVTGHGHADKQAVEKSLKMIFGDQLKKDKKGKLFSSDDESDALAIAVCHAVQAKNLRTSEGIATGVAGNSSKKGGLKEALAHRAKD